MRLLSAGGLVLLALLSPAWSQEAAPVPSPGQVIVSDAKPPAQGNAEASSSQGALEPGPPDTLPGVAVTNAERAAVVIAGWDLDVHLRPAEGREEVQASLTLRNASAAPILRIPLQISSSLRWQTLSLPGAAVRWTQSPIATDEDHTGYAQEAIVTLPKPLTAGQTVRLNAFYAGPLARSAARLELLGVDPDKAANGEWDGIVDTTDAGATALRGFGHVLWYPVAAPAAALGDGNRVAALQAEQRRLALGATMRLRLTVEYAGDPPDAAIFNGKLQPLLRVPDDGDQLVGEAQGVATAEFPEVTLGYRTPSLFLTAQQAAATDGQLLSVVTARPDVTGPYAGAAGLVEPMLSEWLGPTPMTPLVLLDHRGETFEDGAFLAAQLSASARPEDIAPELVPGMTHSWFQSGGAANTWLNEGMAEFMGLLWTERTVAKGTGRGTALEQLSHAAVLMALAEPDFSRTSGVAGEPLISAGSDVYLRVKAASVLWQLREILGEQSFRDALIVFRHTLQVNPAAGRDAHAFQTSLEHTSGKELGWFFDDWVYRDRGLPDLTIGLVNPRALPAKGGKSSGYLVAVEVRNEGDAIAEVPVTVRAGDLSATERVRVAAHSSASTRIIFNGTPETVDVNDGSVPELRVSTHQTRIVMQPAGS